MNFASQELNDWRESSNHFEFSSASSSIKPKVKIDTSELFADNFVFLQPRRKSNARG